MPGKNFPSMPSVTQMVVVKGLHPATFLPCQREGGLSSPGQKERLPAFPSSGMFVEVGFTQ